MPDLSNIIDLTITIAASGITRSGFGTVLIGGYHNRTTGDRVSTYNKVTDMADDDFVSTDLEYIAAGKVKSQEISPKQFKVARLGAVSEGPTMAVSLTATTSAAATDAATFSFEIGLTGGAYQDVVYEAASGANNATIMAGLLAAVTALNSYSGNILATTSGSVLSITGASAGKHFAVRAVNKNLSFQDWTSDPGIAADLNTILDEDSDWYALVLTYKSAAIHLAAAAAIQTLRKVYIAATQDTAVATAGSTDTGSVLKAASYTRTVLLFNDDYMNQPDAALAGVWLPYPPGSETLKFQQLTGIIPTNLSASKLGQLVTKRVNHYITYQGVGIVAEGVVSSTYFADLIRFVDWLYANIQEDLFAMYVAAGGKVPYTPAGLTQHEGVISAVLQRGVTAGGLLPDFTVVMPDFEDIALAQKEARILPDIEFFATSAGAIHGCTINGTVGL